MVLAKICDPFKGLSLKCLSQLSFTSHWNKQTEIYFAFVGFIQA